MGKDRLVEDIKIEMKNLERLKEKNESFIRKSWSSPKFPVKRWPNILT